MEVIDLLRTLTETPGPSGYEERISAVVSELWTAYADEVKTDRIGSVIATKQGQGTEPRPRLLLAAHMDEIGLMVKQILKSDSGYGFLHLTKIGGIDTRHLYGQVAVVHGERDLVGVVGSLPESMLPEERRRKPFAYDELVVDVGLPESELKSLVSVGDFISFRQPLRKMLGGTVTAKALDNRASVAAVTLCLEFLQGRRHDWDVIAVATAQEETGLIGAYTSAFDQFPDAAVAIDVTFAKGAGMSESTLELGGGPSLDIGPNVHPGMFAALQETAGAIEMKVSTSTHARASGTDAFGIQIARAGIPTGLVAIPLRYMHTMVETVATADVERAGRLLGEFAARLEGGFLDNLAKGMMEA